MSRAKFNGPAGWIHHTGGIYTLSGAGPLDPADVIRWTSPAQRIDVRAWFTNDERREAAIGILAGRGASPEHRCRVEAELLCDPAPCWKPAPHYCLGLID